MTAPIQAGDRPRRSWLASPPPTAAVDIASTRVSAVAIASQGGGRAISAYATQPLAKGVVEPGLNAANVLDPDALTAAVAAVLDGLTPRPRRVALVLPDSVAKVSLIRFEKTPARVADLDQLIRWQVRKAAPFNIDGAQIAWIPGLGLDGGGREYIVTVARRDIVESYEAVCQAAGAHAGVVDLATFNLLNAVIASSAGQAAGDWLLVHLASDYATLAVVRGTELVFFRNRSNAGAAELVELVHQTAMYHEDRLGGGGFSRVVLAGAAQQGPEQAERIRRALDERLGSRVESLDFRSAVAMRDRISAGPELLEALAPAVGVLLREDVA